jgi:hypothetical protein
MENETRAAVTAAPIENARYKMNDIRPIFPPRQCIRHAVAKK